MKQIFLTVLLAVLVLSCAGAQQQSQQSSAAATAATAAAEITFTFTRQSGAASNQYAVWIEDTQGHHVKTLYATRWTANGGYLTRPTSIPIWVRIFNLANMSRSQIDAVSGATPSTGTVTYTWDGTNSAGAAVPAGDYVLVLEGTLRWENQVYYRAPFHLGQGAATPQVNIEYISGDRDTTAERAMIRDVRVRVLR